MTGGTHYDTVNTLDTLITLENGSMCTRPQHTPQQTKTKTMSLQKTLPTYKSEAHWQLLIQTAQEAHTIPGVSNLGHPPDQNDSQTHLVVALCLLKPWQRCRLLCKPLQEEEEAKNLLRTPEVKVRTLSGSETPSTSLSDELPGPLEGLEDLADLEAPEDQENQRYPPIILFPSNQQER
jgi:hypothetical protein